MENPIKMDDLGVPLFLETPTSTLGPAKTQVTANHDGYNSWSPKNPRHPVIPNVRIGV